MNLPASLGFLAVNCMEFVGFRMSWHESSSIARGTAKISRQNFCRRLASELCIPRSLSSAAFSKTDLPPTIVLNSRWRRSDICELVAELMLVLSCNFFSTRCRRSCSSDRFHSTAVTSSVCVLVQIAGVRCQQDLGERRKARRVISENDHVFAACNLCPPIPLSKCSCCDPTVQLSASPRQLSYLRLSVRIGFVETLRALANSQLVTHLPADFRLALSAVPFRCKSVKAPSKLTSCDNAFIRRTKPNSGLRVRCSGASTKYLTRSACRNVARSSATRVCRNSIR